MTNSLEKQKIVVIGGSSGIGLSVAKAVAAEGAKLIVASRSESKLEQAKAEIGGETETYQLNISSEESVKNFFEKVGTFNGLVITAFIGLSGTFMEVETAKARQVFDNKFWGSYYAAKYGAAKLEKNGSIIFFSGSAAEKPIAGISAIAAANGAIESLARSLAVELGTIRVNVVSPGLVETPAYSGMPEEWRQGYFESVVNKLPVKRVGQPEDIAEAVIYLIKNKYTTGAIINVDGGNRMV